MQDQMGFQQAALVAVIVLCVTTQAAELTPIFERHLSNCPCTVSVTGYASATGSISVQAISYKSYRAWIRRGRPDSIIRRVSSLHIGKWSVNKRVMRKGNWVIVIHSTAQVFVKSALARALVRTPSRAALRSARRKAQHSGRPSSPLKRPCGLRLSFTSRSALVGNSDELFDTERILNGILVRDAVVARYTAVLRQGYHVCSGALIAPSWVLTAAHCKASEGDTVYIGRSRGKVTARITHPRYTKTATSAYNDVALIRLNEPLPGSQPIAIAGNGNVREGRYARVSGFGSHIRTRDSDVRLRAADMPVASIDSCKTRLIRGGYPVTARHLDERSQICMGHDKCGAVLCSGDSGGPVAVRGQGGVPVLVGILSFTVGRCVGMPEVYSRVAWYADWLSKTSHRAVHVGAL